MNATRVGFPVPGIAAAVSRTASPGSVRIKSVNLISMLSVHPL